MKCTNWTSTAVVGVVFAALLAAGGVVHAPHTANAFYQETTVEGVVGEDLSGIWLAIHDCSASARGRLRAGADPENRLPITVSEVPENLRHLLAERAKGVYITETERAAKQAGIFPGDIIVQLNDELVEGVSGYQEILEGLEEDDWARMRILRTTTRFTSARLLKLAYEAHEAESDGGTIIGHETMKISFLETELPFQKQLDDTRRANTNWEVPQQDIEALREGWAALPLRERRLFMRGVHKVVAASDYDQSLASDRELDDTRFTVLSDMTNNPNGGGGGQTVIMYGVRSVEPGVIRGRYVEALLVSAPFPINVQFKGRFRMIRVADYSDADEVLRAKAKAVEAEKERARLEDVELEPDVPE